MIEAAGLVVGPGVAECDALAAAAHGERYSGSRADGPLVNRSTMLWALGRTDDGVRAALAENGVDIDRFGREEPQDHGRAGADDGTVRARPRA